MRSERGVAVKDTTGTGLIKCLWQMDRKKSKRTAFSNVGGWKNSNINRNKEIRRIQFQGGLRVALDKLSFNYVLSNKIARNMASRVIFSL